MDEILKFKKEAATAKKTENKILMWTFYFARGSLSDSFEAASSIGNLDAVFDKGITSVKIEEADVLEEKDVTLEEVKKKVQKQLESKFLSEKKDLENVLSILNYHNFTLYSKVLNNDIYLDSFFDDLINDFLTEKLQGSEKIGRANVIIRWANSFQCFKNRVAEILDNDKGLQKEISDFLDIADFQNRYAEDADRAESQYWLLYTMKNMYPECKTKQLFEKKLDAIQKEFISD